ncbi:unnamed protein product [Rhizophagus irregularis]|nr:unnamed protein product [Rhizophagus irregularis]
MMNLKSMKKKLVEEELEEGISGFRWFFQVTLEVILTGQAFGHVKFSTGIRILKCYRRALVGYLEIGDNLGSFKTSCY